MITRACISINNRCNLNCNYCHFHTTEKAEHLTESEMNVYTILDNIKQHINKYDIEVFKLGFVGNGEPLLEYGNVYLCGNCVDLPPIAKADTHIDRIKPEIPEFDRNTCFRESRGL